MICVDQRQAFTGLVRSDTIYSIESMYTVFCFFIIIIRLLLLYIQVNYALLM